jgi:beta-lactamase class D
MRLILSGIITLFLFSCSPNNVKTDKELDKYFSDAGVTGCFAMMDNGNGQFTIHNLPRYRDSSFQPGTSFDIVTSLIGLQTGIIVNDSMAISTPAGNDPECGGNLSMYRAFRLSCPGYFKEIAHRIGKDTMQVWLDSLSYGNKKISSIDSFWVDNSLKLKPDEELGLVKRLYFNQLPFYKLNQEIVKKAMLMEDSINYKLSYKTGSGFRENGSNLAWVAGWIEENNHPYLFVLNFETPDRNANIKTIRIKLLKQILRHLGFFEGKM